MNIFRLTGQGRKHCQLVLAQGGVPIILAALSATQTLFDNSLPAQVQRIILPYLIPLWCDATGTLVNITMHLGVSNLITASDGLAILIKLCKRAMPHARVACAALQVSHASSSSATSSA